MKLMERKANRSPALVEAGSAGVVFCICTRDRRLFVATVDTRGITGTPSRNCHQISHALSGESQFNRVELEGCLL
jgi:hypothetical protein